MHLFTYVSLALLYKLVQVRLRHASIQTAGIYTGVSKEEERETINNLYD